MATTLEELSERVKRGDGAAAREIAFRARQGDPDAIFKTAEFHLRGLGGKQDPEAALAEVRRAARSGHAEARRAEAYMTAAGLGCEADLKEAADLLAVIAPSDRFVAVQLAFLQHVTCHERLSTASRETISQDPRIEVVRALFSPEECRYLMLLANPWLEPAMIYASDGSGIRDPHRDSDNMVVSPLAEDLVVHSINRCIAKASGTDVTWGEPLHILRYRPGQQYRPHHDAHDQTPVKKRRLATALLYLNDDYEGGETAFPELDIAVRGHVGDLLIFYNLTEDGAPDPRMMHAGNPIVSGEKWLATRWVRGADYFGR